MARSANADEPSSEDFRTPKLQLKGEEKQKQTNKQTNENLIPKVNGDKTRRLKPVNTRLATGFRGFVQGFTGFYWVRRGFPEFPWIPSSLTSFE